MNNQSFKEVLIIPEPQQTEYPLKEIERDTMPAQVATEMLSDPRVRMTSRMRKVFRDARTKHFISTREATPIDVRLAARLRLRPLLSLMRWLVRANLRRRAGQMAYLRVGANTKLAPPVREDLLRLLELKVAGIDLLIDALETEIQRRKSDVLVFGTGKGNAVKFIKPKKYE